MVPLMPDEDKEPLVALGNLMTSRAHTKGLCLSIKTINLYPVDKCQHERSKMFYTTNDTLNHTINDILFTH